MRPFEVSTESSSYYYEHNGEITLPLQLSITLNHTVERPAAQAALARAARTYPQFSSRLAYVDGRFFYVPNDLPVALYEDEDETCALGSTDTNGYQYRVWASGTTLAIVANHGLADAHFLWRFMSTLLYYYGVERGLVGDGELLEGISREGDVPIPAFDPYVRYADTEQKPIGTPDVGPIFSLPVAYGEDRGDFRCHVDSVVVSFPQLRAAARQSGSRVSPFVSALESAALREVWDAEGKATIGPIMDDMRPFFEVPDVGNFSNWVISVESAQVTGLGLPARCAALQQSMEAQLNEAAMRVQLGRSLAGVAKHRGKSVDELFDFTEQALSTARYTRQFVSLNVSNVGALTLPEPLASMLIEAEYCMPSYSTPFGLIMVGVGDVVRMIITRTFDDDAFEREFVHQLQAQGVDASLEDRGWHDFPTMGRDAVLELDRL